MKIQINDENLEPILVVGIDNEKSSYENIVFRVEEIEDGIISYNTIKEIENLVKKVKDVISEKEYYEHVKSISPILYIVYDTKEEGVFILACDLVLRVEEYKERENDILNSVSRDFSI